MAYNNQDDQPVKENGAEVVRGTRPRSRAEGSVGFFVAKWSMDAWRNTLDLVLEYCRLNHQPISITYGRIVIVRPSLQ